MAKRSLLVGNWKMHGDGGDLPVIAAIGEAARRHSAVDVALCLPATLIDRARGVCPGLAIGGQDCHAEPSGAHTGDISAPMLREAGASLVLLGHSERRQDHHEDDATIAAKVRTAAMAGLIHDTVSGTRVLYGGSVTPENAAAMFAQGGVDGFLVGRQSLDADTFTAILALMD